MSEFNFKSAVCTDRFQSERILALGLKKETADMIHQPIGATPFNAWDKQEIEDDFYPAWSLHRLIEMMPKSIYHNKKDWSKVIYNYSVCYQSEQYSCYWSCEMDLYTDIINCIEWLIKEGYFNKEYLEK